MSNIFGNLNGIAAGIYQLVRQEFIDRPLPVPSNDAMNITYLAPGAGSVLRRLYDRLAESISVADKGAVLNGVTDDAAAVMAAQLTAGRRALAFAGVAHIGTPVTITSPILDTLEQIFTANSQVTIANGRPVRPEWFGDTSIKETMRAAVASLPLVGGVVQMDVARYRSGFDTEADHMTKTNVKFAGLQMPSVSSDGSRLERGSVIEGPFAPFADKCTITNLGIDSGSYVCGKYFGGVGQEGFWIANLSTHPDATTPFDGFHAENIQTLCVKGFAGHSFLCEYVRRAYVNNIRTKYGYHGAIFKADLSYIGNVWSEDHQGNGMILKADNYAACQYSQFKNLTITSTDQGFGGGLTIIAATRSMGHINLSGVRIDKTSYGVDLGAAPGLTLEDVNIDNVEVTNSSTTSFNVRDNTNRIKISNAISANSGTQGFYAQATSKNVTFEDCRAIVSGTAGAPASGFDVRGVGGKMIRCKTADNSGSGLYVAGVQRAIDCDFGGNVGPDIVYGAGARLIGQEFLFDVANLTLKNGWASVGEAPRFWVEGGRLHLSGLAGLAGSGALGTAIFTLPPEYRPLRVMRFAVLCFNGANSVVGELLINPANGDVSLAYGATNYFSLDGISFSLEGN